MSNKALGPEYSPVDRNHDKENKIQLSAAAAIKRAQRARAAAAKRSRSKAAERREKERRAAAKRRVQEQEQEKTRMQEHKQELAKEAEAVGRHEKAEKKKMEDRIRRLVLIIFSDLGVNGGAAFG